MRRIGYDVHRKYASKGVMDLICIRDPDLGNHDPGIVRFYMFNVKLINTIHPKERTELIRTCQ